MNLADTIIAVASAPGLGARGVIRLSGPMTRAILDEHLIASGAGLAARRSEPAPLFGCAAARLGFRAHALPCVVLRYESPRSYTGDDAAELIVPGNPHLLGMIVDDLLARHRRDGVRLAQPGEFTARALLNGRLTPEQAEGVGAVIAARNDAELRAAGRLLSGAAGSEFRALADEIASALALVEAGIDFVDQEDVVPIAPHELRARLGASIGALDRMIGPGAAGEARRAAPRVVLLGAPNAGKSALFNALLGRERAIVSDTAGTTRDVLEEPVALARLIGVAAGFGPESVVLADLAGLDAALASRGAIDAAAQRAARAAVESSDVIVWCDPAGRFDPRELGVALAGKRVIRARTKGDLLRADEAAGARDALAVCALDGWGVPALARAIADAAEHLEHAGGQAEAALLPRHRRAAGAARESLRAALELLNDDAANGPLREPELVAGALRAALDELGAIAGRISPDDIIGRIFATFCVGK